MNLFGDATLRFLVDERRSSAEGWHLLGRVEGQEGRSLLLFQKGGLTGTLRMDDAQYRLTALGDGVVEVTEFPSDDIPPLCGDPLVPPASDQGAVDTTTAEPTLEAASPEIGVLGVYTPAARDGAGGSQFIVGLIQSGIDNANQAYENSNVAQRLRLLGTALVDYGQAIDMTQDLEHLTYVDGRMDEVHQLRDALAADLVMLVVENGNYCGLGWVMGRDHVGAGFAQWGFSVSQRGCLHVARNANPLRRYLLHYSGQADPTIVNPRRLTALRQTQVCGHCHGQRLPHPIDRIRELMSQGDPYVPGQDLSLYTEPIFLERETRLEGVDLRLRFWKDGSPRLTAYEYQGVLLSGKHDRSELSCLSCHAAHGGDPKGMIEPEMRGPKGCVQCHAAIGKDVPAHTRHQPASTGSDCYACHMPRMVYGLLETHLSHRIQNPEPARAWRHDMPEACTLCHLDRSATWAAREWSRMFGQPLPDDLPSGPDFALAESVRALAGGDVVQRAVVLRALSLERSYSGDARRRLWAVPWLLVGLEDDYGAIRHFAWRSLRELLGRPGALGADEAARWAAQPRYDPQAPAPVRAAALASYRDFWRGLDKAGLPPTDDARALGLDADYQVLRERLAPLVARRDTRLISIGE